MVTNLTIFIGNDDDDDDNGDPDSGGCGDDSGHNEYDNYDVGDDVFSQKLAMVRI